MRTVLGLMDCNLTLNVTDCSCFAEGSINSTICDTSGKCTCKENFKGDKCSNCTDGLYGLPSCTTGRKIPITGISSKGHLLLLFNPFQSFTQRIKRMF